MISLEANATLTDPVNAKAIAAAVSHFALVHSGCAFTPLPTGIASTTALQILSVTAAKNWTNVCKKRLKKLKIKR